MKNILFILAMMAVTFVSPSHADTMTNPLIWADTPDPDVIRVGDDYYLVTTTMHMMPGCPIMHSKDLVNWEVISYVFDRIEDNPRYDLIDGTVYGRGQWATTLRYHDGLFYVLFSPNDEPYRSFVYTAENPAGPWTLKCRLPHFHDSSILFDDDGRVYVLSGSGNIRLQELEPDLSAMKEDGVDSVVIKTDNETAGLHEGSRIVKHNGKYYVFIINWPVGKPRRQLCYRSDKITGPYEYKVVLEDNYAGFPYAAQGTAVDTPDGDWWGIFFQDRNAVGRVLTLNPCRWIDGWPVFGDGDGKVLPVVEYTRKGNIERTHLAKTDSFDSDTLGLHWQWNHNPVNSAWSLNDRPGFLRLKTSRKVQNIYDAPNTITQFMEGPECSGSVRLDLSGMKDGDVAGFGAFNGHSALMSVKCEGDKKYLLRHNVIVNLRDTDKSIESVDDIEEQRIDLENDIIYLRIDADFNLGKDKAMCYYSTDGNDWKPIGDEYQMIYDYRRLFMGQRFAIYNYATVTPGGYIDIDYFDYMQHCDK